MSRNRSVSCVHCSRPNALSDRRAYIALDPAVLATGFFADGQQNAEAGQVASLTSKNNFINFCKGQGLPLTNGQQIKTGSCNPAPMGIMAAQSNIPSVKFLFPFNSLEPNETFTVKLTIQNFVLGHSVDSQTNYFAAPQPVDRSGNIIGHTRIVIEPNESFNSTTPTDPFGFVFLRL
jgi:hypothetical protein